MFVAFLTECPWFWSLLGFLPQLNASPSWLHKKTLSQGFHAGNPALLCSLASVAFWNLAPMHCCFKQDKERVFECFYHKEIVSISGDNRVYPSFKISRTTICNCTVTGHLKSLRSLHSFPVFRLYVIKL